MSEIRRNTINQINKQLFLTPKYLIENVAQQLAKI